MKKILRNTYIAALLVFMAGVFCMLPIKNDSSKVGGTSAAEETVVAESLESANTWMSAAAATQSSIVVSGNTYYISNAAGLAELAYNVNNGINDYKGKEIRLSADIDLAGKLWTPIGTKNNPFKGRFDANNDLVGHEERGKNHTISNIAITKESILSDQEYGGLFGYTSDATIKNLKIAGYFADEGGLAAGGSLIGYASNTDIGNCFDITIKESGKVSVYGDNCRIFRSGSFDGINVDCYSQDEIDKTLTADVVSVENYYLATYYFPYTVYSDENFFFFNSSGNVYSLMDVYHKNYKMLRVVLAEDLTSLFESSDTSGPGGYCWSIPTTRHKLLESATKTASKEELLKEIKNRMWVKKPGYEAVIQKFSFSRGLVVPITFNEMDNVTFTLDYEYGNYDYNSQTITNRTFTYTMKYDQAFDEEITRFNRYPHIFLRLGYNVIGFTYYDGEDYRNFSSYTKGNGYETLESYPIDGVTYRVVRSTTRGSAYIDFRISSNEGGSFSSKEDLEEAITAVEVVDSNSSSATCEENTTDSYAYPKYRVDFSSGDHYINLTLAKGFKIDTSKVENITDADYNPDGIKFSQTSGVYLDFPLHTGTGADYDISAANNDDYGQVYAINSVVENADGTKTYSIFIGNLAAPSGDLGNINIVIEREWVKADVSPVWGGLTQDQADVNIRWEINKVAGLTMTESMFNLAYFESEALDKVQTFDSLVSFNSAGEAEDKFYLYARYGELLEAKFTLLDTESYAISGYNYTTITAFTANIRDNQTLMNITSGGDGYNSTYEEELNPRIASRKSKISIQFVDAENPYDSITDGEEANYVIGQNNKYYKKIDNDEFNNNTSYYYGIAVNINSSGEMINNVSTFVNAKAVGGSTQAINNLYYRASYLEIYDKTSALQFTQSLAQEGESVANVFNTEDDITSIYDVDLNNEVAYKIVVYLSKVKYKVGIGAFKLNGEALTETDKEALMNICPVVTEVNDDGTLSDYSSTTSEGIWIAWDKKYNVQWEVTSLGAYILTGGGFFYRPYQPDMDEYLNGKLVRVNDYESYAIGNSTTDEYTDNRNYNYDVSFASSSATDPRVSPRINMIYVNFIWQEIKLRVSEAVDEEENVVSDVVKTGISQSMHFEYDYNEDTQAYYAVLSETTLNPITLSSDYYLVGWDVSASAKPAVGAGEHTFNKKYVDSYSSLLTDRPFIDSAKTVVNLAGHGNSYGYIRAIVAERKVVIKYNPGTVEGTFGKLLASDKETDAAVETLGTYAYADLKNGISLASDVYYNAGHEFSEWSASVGVVSGGKYSITLNSFATLFGDSGESKTWTGFSAVQQGEINLTAVWEKLLYYVIVDGQLTQTLQVGQKIQFYYNGQNRNGLLQYKSEDESFKINGIDHPGYDAVGVNVKGNSNNGEFLLKDDGYGQQKIVVNFAFIEKYLPKENWFATNSDVEDRIEFETMLQHADYKMYIEASANDYYTLDVSSALKTEWGGETGTTSWGGKDETGIYFLISYDENTYTNNAGQSSAVLDNIKNALTEGELILTRNHQETIVSIDGVQTTITSGFQCVGFVYSAYVCGNTEGSKYFININTPEDDKEFDYANDTLAWGNPSYKYNKTEDIVLKPVWKYIGEKGAFAVKFADANVLDANDKTGLYLGVNKEILTVYYLYNGQEIELAGGTQLSNGLVVKSIEIKVGERPVAGSNINLYSFESDEDGVWAKLSFTDKAQPINAVVEASDTIQEKDKINLKKNKLILNGQVRSIYNGTEEFVSIGDEDTAAFKILYDWNGNELSEPTYNLSENFSAYKVGGSDFNVGQKTLCATAKVDLNKNLKFVGYESKTFENITLANVFSNASADGTIEFENGVSVVNAQVPISFTSGSTFSVSGRDIVVAENGDGEFSIGSAAFGYTYDKIILLQTALGKYVGQGGYTLDSQNFKVCGLKVQYYDAEGNKTDDVDVTADDGTLIDGNFLWNISSDSSFELVEEDDLHIVEYKVKWFFHNNGALDYQDLDEAKVILANLKINGSPCEFSENSTQRFMVGQTLVAVFEGIGTNSVRFIYNAAADIKVEFNVTAQNNNGYKAFILGMDTYQNWTANSNEKLMIEHRNPVQINVFSQTFDENTIAEVIEENIVFSSNVLLYFYTNDDRQFPYYLVTVGVPEDYELEFSVFNDMFMNGMQASIDKYNNGYNGVDFAGYVIQNEDGSIDADGQNDRIRVDNENKKIHFFTPGRRVILKTMWTLSDTQTQIISQEKQEINVAACDEELSVGFDDLFKFVQNTVKPNSMVAKIELSSENEDIRIINNGQSSLIGIYNEKLNKYIASTQISGTYKAKVTVEFDDGVQGKQTAVYEFDFSINVGVNKLKIALSGADNLVYNAQDRRGDISASIYLMGNDVDSSVAVNEKVDEGNLTETALLENAIVFNASQIKNATDYSLSFAIAEGYENIYEIVEGESFTISIAKFKLEEEVEEPLIHKGYGSPITAEDLQANYTIDQTGETITISFASKEEGQDIGVYQLFNPSTSNTNYDVSGFVAYFEIDALTRIYFEIREELSYVYNGKTVDGAAFSYDTETEKYTLSLKSGEDVLVSVEAWIGIGQTTPFGEDERSSYAGEIKFADFVGNKNVGVYEFSANTGALAAAGWEEIALTTASKPLSFEILAREVEVTDITKVFDFTNEFNSSSANNSATLSNIVAGEIVVLTGSYQSERVGAWTLENAQLSSGNYKIKNETLSGEIVPSNESVLVEIVKREFDYGDINFGEYALEQFEVSFTAKTMDIDNYISKASARLAISETEELTEANKSTGGFLNAGTYTLIVTYSSPEFGKSDATAVFSGIKIDKINAIVTNSEKPITKVYDETESLPEYALGIVNAADGCYTSAEVLTGDVVEVVNGSFSDKAVGDRIVTIYFSSNNDEGNYNITTNVVGEITRQIITLEKVIEEAFIPDGAFANSAKDDTLSLGANPRFEYPCDESGAEAYGRIEVPTREGYNFKEWKYIDGGYQVLSADGILDLIAKIGLDTTNTTKSIEIYPVWEYQEFDVDGNKVNYFGTITLEYTAEEQYKFTAIEIEGEYVEEEIVGIGTSKVSVTIKNISSDIVIRKVSEKITVTYKFIENNPNKATAPLEITKTIAEIINTDITLPQTPTTNEGTYTFDRWTYVSGSDTKEFESALGVYIDLFSSGIDRDHVVEISGNWTGVDYIITFATDYGTVEGESTLNAVYGQPLPNLPGAITEGRTFTGWVDKANKMYAKGDILLTAGSDENLDGVYELTFKATWTENSYILSIDSIEEGVAVLDVNGDEVSAGATYSIQYGSDGITFKMNTEEGWSYKLVHDGEFSGQISDSEGIILIKDIYDDETISFVKVANINKITIKVANINDISAKVDGNAVEITQEEGGFCIMAATATTVVVTMQEKAGYLIQSASIKLGSAQTKLVVGEKSNGQVSMTLSDFTTNATLQVVVEARKNKLDIGNMFSTLTDVTFQVNSEEETGEKISIANNDPFYIETGKTLIVEGNVVYGYQDATLYEAKFTKDFETLEFDEVNYVYKYRVVITGFTQDFAFTFTKQERTFKFRLAVLEEDEAFATIDEAFETQEVAFNGYLSLNGLQTVARYMLVGWVDASGNAFANPEEDKVQITASMKNLLEGVEETVIYADIDANKITMTIITDDGSLFIGQKEILDSIWIGAGQTTEVGVFLGERTEIHFTPSAGYKFTKIVFFDNQTNELTFEQINGSWNEKGDTVSFDAVENLGGARLYFEKVLHTITVQAGVSIGGNINKPTAVGGRIFLTDASGNKLDDGEYIKPEGVAGGTDYIGQNYLIQRYTGEVLYFVIEAKQGFEPMLETKWVRVGNSYKTNSEGEEVLVYSVSGFTQNVSIYAIMVAKTHSVNISLVTFEGEDENGIMLEQVSAGIIAIETSDYSAALTNQQASVQGLVVSGQDFTFSARTRLGYTMLNESNGDLITYYVQYQQGSTLVEKSISGELLDWKKIGYNQSTGTVTLTEVTDNVNIYIVVIPQVYTVNLVSTTQAGEETLLDTISATYNEMLNLEGLMLDTLNPTPPEVKYAYNGYWTAEDSRGRQYITEDGEAINNWKETGYYYDGQTYQPQPNFNETTGCFTLYVGWRLKTAEIFFNFYPTGVNLNYEFSARSLVVNDELDNVAEEDKVQLWTFKSNKWKVQVFWGTVLQIEAPEILDYEFARIQVEHNNLKSMYTELGVNTLDAVEDGMYVVTLIYNPEFQIAVRNKNSEVNDGGISWIEQEGKDLGSSGVIDFEKPVAVVALPREGYDFLYWENVITGQTYYADYSDENGYRCQFANQVTSPLMLIAVFEGKTVEVNIDNVALLSHHDITSISTNGVVIANPRTNKFNSRIGDEVVITIWKNKGYTITMLSELFILPEIEEEYYIYKFVLTTENTIYDGESKYSINIGFSVEKETIVFKFEKMIHDEEGADIVNEIARVGQLTFIEFSGEQHTIEKEGTFNTLYADTTSLLVKEGTNYKIRSVTLISNGERVDITSRLIDGRLDLNLDIVDRYFSKNMEVEILFERMIWSQEEYRSTSLDGRGTSIDPFIIRNAADMAFAAYLINNDILYKGIEARFAFYKVEADIDFSGKYWQAIGTKECPFEGVFNLGSHRFEYISHYENYENPPATYNGLFWKLSPRAVIIVDRTPVLIMWLIIGGTAILFAGAMVAVAIYRKRKHKILH